MATRGGKGSRSRAKQRRKQERKARKDAMKAQFKAWAESGQHRKSKRAKARAKWAARPAKDYKHTERCYNTGCPTCNPSLLMTPYFQVKAMRQKHATQTS